MVIRPLIIVCAFIFYSQTLAYGSAEDERNATFTVKLYEFEQSPVAAPRRRLKFLVNNPMLAWSHSQFIGALIDTLVDAGHEVHMFTCVLNSNFGNYTGVKRVHAQIHHERPAAKTNAMSKFKLTGEFFDGPKHPLWSGLGKEFTDMMSDLCEELLANKPLMEHFAEQHYDFAISELTTSCIFGIFKVAGVQTMAVAQAISITGLITSTFGIPFFSSFVYDILTVTTSDPMKMTFYDRAKNFATVFFLFLMRDKYYEKDQQLFDTAYGAAAPSLPAVMKNVSLAFINSKDFLDFPRPLSPKIIYVGGITANNEFTQKLLSDQFNAIIDAAPKGAVLFSFGTFADTQLMPIELKSAFADAFAKFPDYAFIWKFNMRANETLKVSPNVHVFEWIPQTALLAHPRLKAFISHCGLNSANEAAKAGVPVLGVPLFGDQLYNAVLIAHKRVGLLVDVLEIRRRGAAVIEEALRELLSDVGYAQRAQLLARKLALTPFSARERFLKWAEFAAEFPELNELNMPTSAEMSFFIYYSLDVISAALVLIAVTFLILIRIFRRIYFFVQNLIRKPNVINNKKLN